MIRDDQDNPKPTLDSGADNGVVNEETEDEDLEDEDLEDGDSSTDDDSDDTDDKNALAEADFVAEMDNFDEFGLDERLMGAIKKKGWTAPTPVQQMCLPIALRGKNLGGFAQTGTGKTGVFLLTLGQKFLSKKPPETTEVTEVTEATETPEARGKSAGKMSRPFAVALAPTRELAIQIENEATDLFADLPIRCMAVYGGADWEKQAKELQAGVDVIVATPGRLKDFHQKNLFSMDDTELFICDEADRMFDMGFIADVEFFMEKLGDDCQKLLFSATTNEEVKELVFKYLDAPEYISVNPESITPDAIDQKAIICSAVNKLKVLMGLMRDTNPERALIFTNTKIVAEWLHYKLENNGIPADVITGDLPQKKRIRLIEKIKKGEVHALIATDVASRGLHIAGVTHVFNFDLPDDPANYVHRIGRTARGGAKGSAYSMVCDDYGQNLVAIQDMLGEVAPAVVWHPEEYLEIEDKAGNPFDAMRKKRAENDAQRGEGRGRGDRDKKDRSRKRRQGAAARTDEETTNPRKSRDRDRDRNRDRDRDGKGRNRRRRPEGDFQRDRGPKGRRHGKGDQQSRQPRHLAQKPVEQPPKSIFGLIKRIFRIFFKKKS